MSKFKKNSYSSFLEILSENLIDFSYHSFLGIPQILEFLFYITQQLLNEISWYLGNNKML